MRLLHVSLARSIWLFSLNDLNPRGKDWRPFASDLVQRYGFTTYPKVGDPLDFQKGIKFESGTFTSPDGDAISLNVTIYNDGIVTDTRSSTKDCDSFLSDILAWVCKLYNLPPYNEVLRSKSYVSELYVHTEKSLNILNPKLRQFCSKLNSLVKGHDVLSYETAGIAFWNDVSLNKPFPFRFERQENVGFNEPRYYSIAPLQTEAHLEMLSELENILAA